MFSFLSFRLISFLSFRLISFSVSFSSNTISLIILDSLHLFFPLIFVLLAEFFPFQSFLNLSTEEYLLSYSLSFLSLCPSHFLSPSPNHIFFSQPFSFIFSSSFEFTLSLQFSFSFYFLSHKHSFSSHSISLIYSLFSINFSFPLFFFLSHTKSVSLYASHSHSLSLSLSHFLSISSAIYSFLRNVDSFSLSHSLSHSLGPLFLLSLSPQVSVN